MKNTPALTGLISLLFVLAATPALTDTLRVEAPRHVAGDTWTTIQWEGGTFEPNWERRTFWDLRPPANTGTMVRWTVVRAPEAGAPRTVQQIGADLAWCAHDDESSARLGCELFDSTRTRPSGPMPIWSDLDDGPHGFLTQLLGSTAQRPIEVGGDFSYGSRDAVGNTRNVEGQGVAEGIVLLPAGPREAVLVREYVSTNGEPSLQYRFLTRSGQTAATLRGPIPAPGAPFIAQQIQTLATSNLLANDGLTIAYDDLSTALAPGSTGFLQRAMIPSTLSDDPDNEPQGRPIDFINATWSGIADALSIDATSVGYQPDPGDATSLQTLPEVWDFSGLAPSSLTYRTFNTTRDDPDLSTCLQSVSAQCTSRDVGANPPDGTWQSYLKIDRFTPTGTQFSRDIFLLNDNDTGANPSIDVSFVAQDEFNTSDRTQICFATAAGGPDRFLQFFEFKGASPATALLGKDVDRDTIDDNWFSGNWESCNSGEGVQLTAASVCNDGCFTDGCPGAPLAVQPYARGLLPGNAGLRSTIVEDGFVQMPTGNFIPALLMQQDTHLEAGADFIGTCNLATTPQRTYDYFWLNEYYGLLALMSSPHDATHTATDWSNVCNNVGMVQQCNLIDRADFTWGPFPPPQTEAQACLSGTKISWTLPTDGSTLDGEPNVTDYGYVVSWGSETDPEQLADWATTPDGVCAAGDLNAGASCSVSTECDLAALGDGLGTCNPGGRTPLPGAPGYLAAPFGSEPTSTVITAWAGTSVNATVVTALHYTDPDFSDTATYRSAAFYKVQQNPATLDPGLFQVGNGVAPFSARSGSDIALTWPSVGDAGSYLVRVWDLNTKTEIPCPGGMDCTPSIPSTIHPGADTDGNNYGYRAYAVDACDIASAN